MNGNWQKADLKMLAKFTKLTICFAFGNIEKKRKKKNLFSFYRCGLGGVGLQAKQVFAKENEKHVLITDMTEKRSSV